MLEILQEMVRASMAGSMPLSFVDGVVLTAAPDITIQVGNNSKLIIDQDQIIVSQSLLARTQSIEIANQLYKTSENGSYTPIWIKGDMQITNELEVGETVLMLRFNEGQRYYILDRGVSYGADS